MIAIRGLQRVLHKWAPDKKINVEVRFLLEIQRNGLPELMSQVKHGRLRKHFAKLNPFVDSHGLIKVGGRLYGIPLLSQKQQNPIILPKLHKCVEHLILDMHRNLLKHVGGPLHLYNTRSK